MEFSSERLIAVANDRRPGLLLQLIGLLVFLASMPLDVLNGHGKGFIADWDHFQGWEVVYFGFLFSSWLFQGEWNSLAFLPIAITSAFTLGLPIVHLWRLRVGPGVSRTINAAAVVSLILTALFMLKWASDVGAFWGAIPWLGGAALVVLGSLRQTAARTA